MIQGYQPEFQIWETDVDTNINVVQISIYSNPTSTDILKVELIGEEMKQLYVPPGNTINVVSQGIRSIMISSQGNEFTYIEGKYTISITLQLHANSALVNEQ